MADENADRNVADGDEVASVPPAVQVAADNPWADQDANPLFLRPPWHADPEFRHLGFDL